MLLKTSELSWIIGFILTMTLQIIREGEKKLDFLGDMSPIRWGSTPIPLKKADFFQIKRRKYSACPEKPFLLKPYFCIVTFVYSLSTGSNEIFIKRKKKVFVTRVEG